jgi:hypothetical protein
MTVPFSGNFRIVRNCQERLDFVPRTIDQARAFWLCSDRPARRGARHDRFHCAGLDAVAATMPGLKERGLRMERPGAAGPRATNAGAAGGRSKCMSGRQSVRTQAACPQKGQFLGTCSKPQNPSACGTQASSCFCGDPDGPLSRQDRVTRKGTHCPLPRQREPRLLLSSSWRRWRGEPPGVPHAPSGGRRNRKDRRASKSE